MSVSVQDAMSSPLITATPEPAVVRRRARQEVTVVSARRSVSYRVREVWRYRQLLLSLVRKELKVKYKDSVLGFAWSMLNPLFTLCIYFVVFQIILANGIPLFAIYLLSGLLVWNFFSNALPGAAGSVTGNSEIVKKVSFPREVLPLASVGAAAFNFGLQLIVMTVALIGFRHPPSPEFLLISVVAFAILVVLTSGLSIFLAAVNVKYRDTQHLLELVLMLWFWGTPIVYQIAGQPGTNFFLTKLITHHLDIVYFANPVTPIVLTFQRAFYNNLDPITTDKHSHVPSTHWILPHLDLGWFAVHLPIVAVVACAVTYGGLVVFGRLEGNFAEEL